MMEKIIKTFTNTKTVTTEELSVFLLEVQAYNADAIHHILGEEGFNLVSERC